MDKAALLLKLQQIKESTKQIIEGESNDGETTTDATTDQEQS